jgi:hypothetical protein
MDVAPHPDSRFSTTPDWSVPAKRNLRVAVYTFSGESPIAVQDRGIVAFACEGFRIGQIARLLAAPPNDEGLRFERVAVFFVLAEIEADRFGFLIDAQAHDCVSYFEQYQAADKGEGDARGDRDGLYQQLPGIAV